MYIIFPLRRENISIRNRRKYYDGRRGHKALHNSNYVSRTGVSAAKSILISLF